MKPCVAQQPLSLVMHAGPPPVPDAVASAVAAPSAGGWSPSGSSSLSARYNQLRHLIAQAPTGDAAASGSSTPPSSSDLGDIMSSATAQLVPGAALSSRSILEMTGHLMSRTALYQCVQRLMATPTPELYQSGADFLPLLWCSLLIVGARSTHSHLSTHCRRYGGRRCSRGG